MCDSNRYLTPRVTDGARGIDAICARERRVCAASWFLDWHRAWVARAPRAGRGARAGVRRHGVRRAVQDFVSTGDVRKYHRPAFASPVGYYQEFAPGTGQRQISYDLIYHQGWDSERTRTFLHEATHSYRNMGNEIDSWDPLGTGTYWVENNCFNWW